MASRRSSPAHSTTRLPGRDLPRRARDVEYCVVDVETTGFSPRLGDRVIEIAAVRMRADGEVLDEWTTLVNPARDIGATHIHGISAADVLAAPAFAQVGGDLLQRLDGAVMVAHNLRFDRGFIDAEFARAQRPLPAWPGLCTLALSHRVRAGRSRKLVDCCAEYGIALTDAHSALADARATAQLLAAYLSVAGRRGMGDLAQLGCTPLSWPQELPRIAPCGCVHHRGAGQRRVSAQGDRLTRLMQSLPDTGTRDPDLAAYLNLLERALEDRRLTAQEAHALVDTAREWRLDPAAVLSAHRRHLALLEDAARADGIVSEAERIDLELVARPLNLPAAAPEDASEDAATRRGDDRPPPPREASPSGDLSGLSVCFTGTLTSRINGRPLSRTRAAELAQLAGLRVAASVTRKLGLLVVADPDSLSTKARRARELGTRIMAERVFWHSIGVRVD